MFYTDLGLTQYEMHDPVSFLDRYNKDMQIITTTATVAAGKIEMVDQESKDRDENLQDEIDKNHNDIVDNANNITELQTKDNLLEAAIKLNAQDIEALQVTTTSISAQLLNHIETSTSYAAGILKEVKDNYTELKTDILADRERLAVAETAIANIEQGDAEIAGRVTALEADNEQNKNSIASLERVDSEHAESINDLKNRVTTAESKILQNTNDITSLDGRIEIAEQNIEDLQKTKIQNYTLTAAVTMYTGDYSDGINTLTELSKRQFTVKGDNNPQLLLPMPVSISDSIRIDTLPEGTSYVTAKFEIEGYEIYTAGNVATMAYAKTDNSMEENSSDTDLFVPELYTSIEIYDAKTYASVYYTPPKYLYVKKV